MKFSEGSDCRSRPTVPKRGNLFMCSKEHLSTNGDELERNLALEDKKVQTG
jgi:hypothetical protein